MNSGGREEEDNDRYVAPAGEFVSESPAEPEWRPEDAGIGFGRDLPYRGRRKTSGLGKSYSDGSGHVRKDMVKVAVEGPGGIIEYLDGDDPRAKEALKARPELDSYDRRVVEQTSVETSTIPSDTGSQSIVERH